MEETQEQRNQRMRDKGWDGVECQMCFVRRKAIEDRTWNVGFRRCPHCGAAWR